MRRKWGKAIGNTLQEIGANWSSAGHKVIGKCQRWKKRNLIASFFFSASPRFAQPANEPLSLNFMLSSWSLKYSQTDLNYPKVASFEIWVTFEMLQSVLELTLCDDAWYWVVLYWVTGVTLVLGRVKISKAVDLKFLQQESKEIPSISKFQSLKKMPSLQVLFLLWVCPE